MLETFLNQLFNHKDILMWVLIGIFALLLLIPLATIVYIVTTILN